MSGLTPPPPEWVDYLRRAIKAYEIDRALVAGWLAVECKIAAYPGEEFGWINRHTYNPPLLERLTPWECVKLLRQIWEWNRNPNLYAPIAKEAFAA